MSDNTHLYNLKAVMQEVGINAATLRAWERRYNLPKPQRSSGGHRLYSRQDIEMLKWLVARQSEGLSISHAIEMWKTQHEPGRELVGQLEPSTPMPAMGEAMLDELRERWISACSSFDDALANRILDQAFALAAPETICSEVLQKGLVQVGDGWYAGKISVQQEHFATAIANRRISSLLAAVTPPTRRDNILMACPPGEEHDFILLVLTYLLRRQGWQAIYLGANVPLLNLDTTIRFTKPNMILSAAQTLEAAASLRQMSEYLRSIKIPLAFGGGIFTQVPNSIQYIPGYYLGKDLALVPKLLEQLLTAPPTLPNLIPTSLEYTITLKQFAQNEKRVAAYVSAALQNAPIDPAHLAIANDNLNRLVSSALQLGDINLMDQSMAWLDGLLRNRGISPSILGNFYAIYMEALVKYLGKEGAIIREWMSKLILDHVDKH
jgi:DNA-binding transcriptional MerR regulator